MNFKDFDKAVGRAQELIRYLTEKPEDTPFLHKSEQEIREEEKAAKAEQRRISRPRSRKRKKNISKNKGSEAKSE